MTKYKASLRLAEEPYRIIKWFTKNWDKEIGALGIGVVEDGEMYIEKLVFPKQIVNGAHVHFKPEDWGSILMKLTQEEISKIIFYWHKHPGCAKASQGDEDDTFDVFMPEDTDRPYFGFMQTADKTGTGFEYEARIEMRKPIFCSITDVEMFTDLDIDTKEQCEKIIEECVTTGNASASDQPGFKREETKTGLNVPEVIYDVDDDEEIEKPIFKINQKNGNIYITCSIYFESWISELFTEDPLKNSHSKMDCKYNGELLEVCITPRKKQGKIIFRYLKDVQQEIFYKESEEPIEEEEEDSDTLDNNLDYKNQFSTNKDMARHRENNYANQRGYDIYQGWW